MMTYLSSMLTMLPILPKQFCKSSLRVYSGRPPMYTLFGCMAEDKQPSSRRENRQRDDDEVEARVAWRVMSLQSQPAALREGRKSAYHDNPEEGGVVIKAKRACESSNGTGIGHGGQIRCIDSAHLSPPANRKHGPSR